jgi:DNA polymerase I-like protein with 3'-5' exonuclease and polymerase domains
LTRPSQLEWRVAVDLSADTVGIKEIKDKLDTHSINQEAFMLPSRLIAKIYLFRTIFRGSGYAFAMDKEFKHVSDKPEFWENVNNKFYKKYAGLDSWHHILANKVLSGLPITGPSGRFWQIPLGVDNRGAIKIPWTTLSNYPVQGTANDIMAIARVSLNNRVKKEKLRAIPIITVHDSIGYDAPDEELDYLATLMYDVFRDLPSNFEKLFNYKMNVPYTCEVKFGPNLTDMEKYVPSNY